MSWAALAASMAWYPFLGSVHMITAKFALATHAPEVLSLARQDRFFGSWTRMKRQCWELTPLCVSLAASRTAILTSAPTGFESNSRTSSLVLTASVVFMPNLLCRGRVCSLGRHLSGASPPWLG